MSFCKACGNPMDWGFCDGKWVPLEPVATHDDLPRTFVDENGELRADHRDRCRNSGGGSVNVTRLDRKVQPTEVITPKTPKTKQRRRRHRAA